jgi:hypothetical protein
MVRRRRSRPTAGFSGLVVTRLMTLASISMDDLLKHSTLYQEFLAERDEILKHKWIESEKAGYDIGFERALLDWLVNHSAAWRRWRRSLREPLPAASPGGTDAHP